MKAREGIEEEEEEKKEEESSSTRGGLYSWQVDGLGLQQRGQDESRG